MTQRDVELRIKAKAQTDASLERLGKLLKDIEQKGEESVGGLNKSSAAVARISKEIADLQAEAAKLRAFDRLTGEVGKMTGTLDGAKKTLAATEAQLADLTSQQAAAAKSAADYRAQMDAEKASLGQLTKARSADKTALSQLESELLAYEKALSKANEEQARAQRMRRTEGVGQFDPAPTSSARQSAKVLLPAFIDDLRSQQTALNASLAEFDANIKKTQSSIGELKTKVDVVADAEGQFNKQIRSTNTALEAQRIQVDVNGKALSDAAAKVHSASAALGGLAADQRAVATEIDRVNADLRQQREALARVTQAEHDMAAARRKSQFEGREALSITQRIKAEVLALITAYIGLNGAIQSINRAVNATRDLEAATNRLGTVFNQDMGRVGEEMDFIRGTADRLGIAMTDLGLAYSKFAVAANGSRFSAEATRKVFIGVAEAGRVNKLSLDQLNGVFLALEQMISKGKIQAEELRGQLGERLPGAVSILANALGVTTAELDKMMEKGQVFATEDTMLKFVDELNNRFSAQLPASLQNLSADMGRFENDLDKVALAFAEGVIPGVQEALKSFNAFVNSSDGQQFFVNLGEAVGTAVEALGWLIQNFDDVYDVAVMLVSISVGATILGWARDFATLATGAIEASGAVTRTAKAAALFRALTGGWAGLLAAIVGSAVAAGAGFWLANKAGADNSTLALSEHERQMRAVNEAYEVAADKTGKWYENISNLTRLDVEQNGRDLAASYNKAIDEIKGALEELDFAATLMDNAGGLNTDPEVKRQIAEFKAQFEELQRVVDGLTTGTMSVGQAKGILSGIVSNSDIEDIRDAASAVDDLIDVTRDGDGTLEDLQKALAENAELSILFGANASEAAKALMATRKAADESADSMDKGSEKTQQFADAMDALRAKVPSLAAEIERMGELDALKKLRDQALEAATSWQQAAGAVRLYNRAVDEMNLSDTNWEAVYTAGRSAPQGAQMEELVRATSALAEQLGISAKDLLAVMSFETGGTFDPWKAGPTTQWGQHRGLIQWGEPQRERYGVSETSTITDQVVAAGKYLQDAGVKAGDGLMQIYAAVLAGDASKINAGDTNNGGVVDSVLEATSGPQFDAHKARAEGLLAAYAGVSEEAAAAAIAEANLAQATKDRVADLQFEVDQQQLINAGKEKQAAVEEAIRDAKAEGITDPQALADIEALTAKSWELANAKSAITLEEEKVNRLMEMRSQIEAQLQMAQESGDTSLAATLTQDLTNLNTEITAAINNLIRMWEAAGGPEADLAIAKLRTALMQVTAVKTETSKLGLTANQWSSVIGSMVDGLTNAFKAMGEAIARGENAARAFGTAVAQVFAQLMIDIGLAIIKQTILNALLRMAGGPSTFFGGILSSLGAKGHTGGLVGSSAIGGGNSLASGMSAWRSGLTYHTGGIAGLKPDEVNATLKVNEEILTTDDPRHRFNMGGESQSSSMGIRQVLAIGDDEIANAMSGRAGEKTVLSIIRRNRATLRTELG